MAGKEETVRVAGKEIQLVTSGDGTALRAEFP